MNEVGFKREIFDFLKTGYGVTDAIVEGGGKHNALVFTRPNGPRIKTTWPRGPIGGLDWQRTLEIKRKDLIHMLGTPAPEPTRQRSRMEDLMPAPKEPPVELADQIREKLPSLAAQLAPEKPPFLAAQAIDLQGWMFACYDNKNSSYLRVSFPKSDLDKVGQNSAITEIESGVWHLARSARGPGVYIYGPDRMYVQWSVARMKSFGYTPCKAHITDDGVVVRLPDLDSRKALDVRFKAKSPRRASAAAIAQPPELPTTANGTPTVDDIRATLASIRRIEAETPYRLIRDGDAWVFDPGLARIV